MPGAMSAANVRNGVRISFFLLFHALKVEKLGAMKVHFCNLVILGLC